ncbi:MAG: DUF4340 domain-containing protein [Magnetococcales bacterium]|nr:DUF4340 domain-containing protein [Magnetococcales bacterium]MBF0322123.1 DUF4340 domain-containing protein [Magnetococcales bacterium]
MFRGWMINLLLLAILLACGAGLWLADRNEIQKKNAEELSRAISTLTVAKLTRATLQPKGENSITLEKKSDKWEITSPGSMLTDQEAVTRLFAVLERHFKEKITDKPDNPGDFGLAEPDAVLTLHDAASGAPTVLQLGSQSPTSTNRYLRLGADGPVVMVPSYEISGLTQKLQDLRAKKWGVSLENQQIVAMGLVDKDGQEIHLKQDQNGSWQLVKPFADRASGHLVQGWLDGLLHAAAVSFAVGTPPEKPDWKLTLQPGKGEPLVLVAWRSGGSLLARRPGDPDNMILEATIAKMLDKPPLSLVDLRPLPPGLDLQRLLLDRGEKHLDAERKKTAEGKSVEVDKMAVHGKVKEEGDWPHPAWQSVAEVLLRDAVAAEAEAPLVPPDFVVTVENKGVPFKIPFKKEGESYQLAPPDRPLLLRLTPLQSVSLDESLKALFPETKETKEKK